MAKDEEMARLFIINKYNLRKDLSIYAIEDNYELGREYYAFLAGLKAGRPQWHDLRKDPTDLPKENSKVYLYAKDKEYYMGSFENGAWKYDGEFYASDDFVIAWCEKPTFDKEPMEE